MKRGAQASEYVSNPCCVFFAPRGLQFCHEWSSGRCIICFFCHGISGQNTDSPCAPNNGVIRVRTMYSAVVARSGLWFTLRLGSAHVHNCFISTTPLFVGTMAAKHLTLDEQMLIDTVVKKEKGSGMDAFRAVAKARTKQSGIPPHKGTVYGYIDGDTHRRGIKETRGRKRLLTRRDIQKIQQCRRRLIKGAAMGERGKCGFAPARRPTDAEAKVSLSQTNGQARHLGFFCMEGDRWTRKRRFR